MSKDSKVHSLVVHHPTMKSFKWTSAFWVFLILALINADAENSRFKDTSNQASKSGAADITSAVSHEVCESALTDNRRQEKP